MRRLLHGFSTCVERRWCNIYFSTRCFSSTLLNAAESAIPLYLKVRRLRCPSLLRMFFFHSSDSSLCNTRYTVENLCASSFRSCRYHLAALIHPTNPLLPSSKTTNTFCAFLHFRQFRLTIAKITPASKNPPSESTACK